ncbi:MAG: PEP-CTERM sorting domain-containing protein [Phycisphaerae bacterium]
MFRRSLSATLFLALIPVLALAQTPYLVRDINPNGDSYASSFTVYNGALYFNASDDVHGFELWRSDGTFAGTQMVSDLRPGFDGSFPTGMTQYNGRLYYAANDGVNGNELWSTDGTAAGTAFVADCNPGPDSGNPEVFVPVGGTMFFRAFNAYGIELWKSNGTGPETNMVKDIHLNDWSLPSGITELNGQVYFGADDSYDEAYGYDRELWTSDGTEAGTVRVLDINPGPAGSIPTSFTRLGNELIFQARESTHGIELWRTDGTETGTTLLKDINPTGSGAPTMLTQIDNYVYFNASNGVDGAEVWRTDGTAAGTLQIADINPTGASDPLYFTALNDGVVFTADDGVHGIELWWTDGSEAGTHMIKDINPGDALSSPLFLTVVGDEVYFATVEQGSEEWTVLTSLWKSDGTEEGTVRVWDAPGEWFGYSITDLNLVGDTLFFMAPTGFDSSGYSENFELHALTVPEPATGLLLLGGLILSLRRRG